MEFDTRVKLALYQMIADRATVPSSDDVAAALSLSPTDVETAFSRLAAKRLLVLEPGSPSRIRMAPPFSGIETPFPVAANSKTYYANCIWDALGVAAALHTDAVINASDAHTGDAITLKVQNAQPLPRNSVAHFAVPAAHWWDDIIYT